MKATQRKGAKEAQNTLPDLLEAAEQGQSTIITKHGRPVAALMSIATCDAASHQQPLLPMEGSATVTIAEVMTGLRGLVTRRQRAILESWEFVSLDIDLAESAARLRASLRLKLADAVQAASALAINAAALVIHDRDFSRVRSLRIIS